MSIIYYSDAQGLDKEQANYQQAREILEKCRFIYEKNKSVIYVYFKVLLVSLGNVYIELGDNETAKKFLEKSLMLLEKHYGKGHVQTARALNVLGNAYLKEANFNKAEEFIQKALEIYKKNSHTDIYLSLENLAALCEQKAKEAQKKGNTTEAEKLKKQSINYLTQALDIIKSAFPKDSAHLVRLKSKLTNAEKILYNQ